MTENYILTDTYISNGKVYVFDSDPFEPKEKLNKRAWFIIKYIEKNNLVNLSQNYLDEIIILSRKWLNEDCSGAEY